MSRTLSGLLRCAVVAGKEKAGTVEDVYFDDVRWEVRYVVVETGGLISGRSVLLTPSVVTEIHVQRGFLVVNLTKEQVTTALDAGDEMPVFKVHEEQLHSYFQWPFYWGRSETLFEGRSPRRPMSSDILEEQEERIKRSIHDDPPTHLRSLLEIRGYHVKREDVDIGRVRDLLIGDADWAIESFLIRHPRGGAYERIPQSCIRDISWREKSIFVR